MILMGKQAKTIQGARVLAQEMLSSGQALTLFNKVIRAQGGNLPLPKAEAREDLIAPRSGFISKMLTEEIGIASLMLGAGRTKAEDKVDPSAGILLHFKIGDRVQKGDV